LQLTNKIKETTLNRACVSVSASRSRSWTFQETSRVNYPEIKTYNIAEQMGSYTPQPTREMYGSIILGENLHTQAAKYPKKRKRKKTLLF